MTKQGLSHYVADLHNEKEAIVVYGNFAMFKKNASLPNHIINQMDKQDLVAYFCDKGLWSEVGEMAGYKVYRIEAGTEKIYMCTTESDIKFLIGV